MNLQDKLSCSGRKLTVCDFIVRPEYWNFANHSRLYRFSRRVPWLELPAEPVGWAGVRGWPFGNACWSVVPGIRVQLFQGKFVLGCRLEGFHSALLGFHSQLLSRKFMISCFRYFVVSGIRAQLLWCRSVILVIRIRLSFYGFVSSCLSRGFVPVCPFHATRILPFSRRFAFVCCFRKSSCCCLEDWCASVVAGIRVRVCFVFLSLGFVDRFVGSRSAFVSGIHVRQLSGISGRLWRGDSCSAGSGIRVCFVFRGFVCCLGDSDWLAEETCPHNPSGGICISYSAYTYLYVYRCSDICVCVRCMNANVETYMRVCVYCCLSASM